MSTSTIIEISAVVYFVAAVADLALARRWRRFLIEIAVLAVLLALDVLVTNASIGHVAFGPGNSNTFVAGLMFVGTIAGIAARYIFYLKTPFSWLGLLKPLCISPIVLLPLIGSIQNIKELDAMQTISFALLAFQNGFFWEVVLERVQPKS